MIQLCLALSRRRPLSYRNKSIDLPRKSMDWLLYNNGLRLERADDDDYDDDDDDDDELFLWYG